LDYVSKYLQSSAVTSLQEDSQTPQAQNSAATAFSEAV
jgi:hypothetical protein